MILTPEYLRGLWRGYNTILNNSLAQGPAGEKPLHGLLCVESKSVSAEEEHDWMGELPILREQVVEADQPVKNLATNQFTIPNIVFSRLLKLRREALERDKANLYSTRIRNAGEAAGRTWDHLLMTRLVAGFSAPDYTGSAFFADSKTINAASSVTFDNKDTKKFSADNLSAAITSLKNRKDAEGVSLNLGGEGFDLIVSPSYEATARAAVELPYLAGGASNPNYHRATLHVSGHLGAISEHAWFVFARNGGSKPFIKQIEVPISSYMCTDPNDSHVLKYGEFLFQLYGRFNIGYGESLLAWGSDGTTAAA